MGRATGWLARAQRLLEHEERECVERGYLLLPVVEQHLAAGDFEAAYATAADAAEIGERCGDADLIACARHQQGRVRQCSRAGRGGARAAGRGDGRGHRGRAVAPRDAVLIYCSVIEACQQVYALRRAREWTSALAQVVRGATRHGRLHRHCLVHRAEIMQLQRRLAGRDRGGAARLRACAQAMNRQAAAAALYQQAEVHRLRGEFAAAEEAYRSASQGGWEPQPGLALLRLAQGRADAAAAAIRRALGETRDRLQRTRAAARLHRDHAWPPATSRTRATPAASWRRSPARFDTGVLGAMAAHARGAVELAEGDAQAALGSLRRAFEVWQQIEAPYAAARVRVLIGLACRALGDDDGGRAGAGGGAGGVRAAGRRAGSRPHRLARASRTVGGHAMG